MKTNKHNDGGAYQKLHRSELYDDHVMRWCGVLVLSVILIPAAPLSLLFGRISTWSTLRNRNPIKLADIETAFMLISAFSMNQFDEFINQILTYKHNNESPALVKSLKNVGMDCDRNIDKLLYSKKQELLYIAKKIISKY